MAFSAVSGHDTQKYGLPGRAVWRDHLRRLNGGNRRGK
jgi:hypothetical protein